MNSIIRIDVFSAVTRIPVFRVEINDIISNNEEIHTAETFADADGRFNVRTRQNGEVDTEFLINQYFSQDGNSVDEYTVIYITQLNPNDIIMFNNLFRSRQPDPYVIEDCISFIVSDEVEGLTLPIPGFHLDNEEENELQPRRLFADDDDDDDDDFGPLPERIPELRRGVAMRFVEDEPPPPMTQAERNERNRRQQEMANRMALAAQQPVNADEEQPFPRCAICNGYLNNHDGPGPSEKCQENCNDVVNVCGNNHLFHRGCILNSCKAERVDVAAQMGFPQYSHFEEQSIATECPLCREQLEPNCEGLRDKERVPTENINEEGLIKGGISRKTRKSRNKGKNKKSMKKEKNKKSMKKEKNKKLVKKGKSMKRRKMMKKGK